MSTPALSSEPVLIISVNDSGVVFSGASNVYRYDQPSMAEVASHVRSVIGDNPAGVVVHVVAPDNKINELERALSGYDVTLTTEHPGEAEAQPSEPTELLRIARPPADKHQHASRSPSKDLWIIAGAVVAVAGMVTAAVWLTLGVGAQDNEVAVAQDTSAPSSGVPSSVVPSPTTSLVSPPGVVVERGGLRVELPTGYTVEPDNDMWRATGEDPNLRIQIAVENLHPLTPQQMVDQVVADIDADPEVELLSQEAEVIYYEQTALDGSRSHWKTWADGGRQLFVGCHFRWEPTTAQRATCRVVMDSASFDAEGLQDESF
ncbi:type VII secretion-associated protein [Corynebacterium mayonis]|uniref:type VII secretion-associated protein n=1 Tax=Corynebacterium mayonis TaxID=3062461 RepID=UPI00313FFFC0